MRPRRFVWWVSLAVFVFSAAWLASYVYQAYSGAKSIERLSGGIVALRAAEAPADSPEAAPGAAEAADKKEALRGAGAEPQPEAGEGSPAKAGAKPQPEAGEGSSAGAGADFSSEADAQILSAYAELARKNPDMAGWVHIEGTAVDYPVMHTPDDPEKYLHRDFEDRYAFAGLPFLDAACEPDADSSNLIVYAHNMRSGQMFARLTDYLDAGFRQSHPLISFDTLARRRGYEVVAVLRLTAAGRQEPSMRCYRQIDTTDQQAVDDLNEYLRRFASAREGAFQPGDGILTLSTCEHASSADRLVVMARRARG